MTDPSTIRRQAMEEAKTAVRYAMVDYEWPPRDGDAQIDHVLAALDALLPQPKDEAEEMGAFGAHEVACYLYPRADQRKERAAFCEGAARAFLAKGSANAVR